MKKVFISHENPLLEMAKRTIYSFQVLAVGIAIPFLFLVGISYENQKRQEPVVTEISKTNPAPANTVGLIMPRI